MKNRIYLDHHSATSVFPSALEKMNTFYRDPWVESSLSFQQLSNEILKSLGDGGDSVFHFSSSGAEAINSAFCSHYFDTLRSSGQNHILTSQLENAPIFFSIQRLEELGCTAKLLYPNEQGQITKQMLLAAIKPRTGLLSISWAQGLTGVIHPLADLAEVCREKDVALHVDATYALGKIYFCLKDLPIDFLTFDGQLLHAPHGTGGIICKKKAPFSALIAGQSSPPMAAMQALCHAFLENLQYSDHLCLEIARLRDRLEQGIKQQIPDAVVFFEHVERLPNCTAIAFPDVMAEALLYLLYRHGVYATIGGGTIQRLSHVLIASGVSSLLAQSAISFSLSFDTTQEQIDYAIETIVLCVGRLRKCSLAIAGETL